MTTPIPPDPMVPMPAKRNSSAPVWIVIALVAFLIIALGCCGGIVTCSYFARKNAPAIAQAPANFPSDIPLAGGFAVSQSVTDDTGSTGILTLSGPATVESVASFYRSNMPANGWTSDNDKNFGDRAVQAYSKSVRRAAILINKESDERSTVVITYSDH